MYVFVFSCVVMVALYTRALVRHLPFNGQISLFLQLHDWLGISSLVLLIIFELCALMIDPIFFHATVAHFNVVFVKDFMVLVSSWEVFVY